MGAFPSLTSRSTGSQGSPPDSSLCDNWAPKVLWSSSSRFGRRKQSSVARQRAGVFQSGSFAAALPGRAAARQTRRARACRVVTQTRFRRSGALAPGVATRPGWLPATRRPPHSLRLSERQGMLSREFSRHFLPAGKNLSIRKKSNNSRPEFPAGRKSGCDLGGEGDKTSL